MSGAADLLSQSAELHFKAVRILDVETRLSVSPEDLHTTALQFCFHLLFARVPVCNCVRNVIDPLKAESAQRGCCCQTSAGTVFRYLR